MHDEAHANELGERIAQHFAIISEIDAKRAETGNSSLFYAVERSIIKEHLNALQRAATLPAPILTQKAAIIARGRSRWFRPEH